MMKRFLVIGLVVTSSIMCGAVKDKYEADKDRLYDALEESDPINTKKYLRRLCPLLAEKKADLVYAAEDILDAKESKVSLGKSKKDLACLVIGSLATIVGALAAWDSYRDYKNTSLSKDAQDQAAFVAVIEAALAVSGVPLAAYGWLCKIAKNRVALAQKVLNEVMNAKVKDEPKQAVKV